MRNLTRGVERGFCALVCVALSASILLTPALAVDTTKVKGVITDDSGKPLAKVEVWFENAKIEGKIAGPVKTNRKGRYIYPFLDIGIEAEWRVVPKLPGYKILKISWKLIDSYRNDRGSSEVILDAKQEIPSIHPVLVGSDGSNEVDFVMIKEAEFQGALRRAVAEKQGTPIPAGEESAAAPAEGLDAAAVGVEEAAPAKSVSDALEMMKAGDNSEAIPILKDYLEKNPNNAPVQFTLGKAYILTKQYQEALPPLTKALELNASQGGAHFYRGIAHSQMGQDEEAIQEFLAEIPINPDQDATYSNLASIYEKQGKIDEALEYYKKAAEINPQRPELHASMASIYEKKGDEANAALEYKALADVDPTNAAVTWYNIGAIAKNSDKAQEAVRAFKKSVELDPKYAPAHRELGYALVQQGDFAGAVAHFKQYLALAPGAADAGEIKIMVQQLSQ